jgi:hypothetical protein
LNQQIRRACSGVLIPCSDSVDSEKPIEHLMPFDFILSKNRSPIAVVLVPRQGSR